MPEEKFIKLKSVETHVELPALVCVVNSIDEIVECANIPQSHLTPTKRAAIQALDNFQSVIRLGRCAHVQYIVTIRSLCSPHFPLDLKGNLRQRFCCKPMDKPMSEYWFNSLEGCNIPNENGWCMGKSIDDSNGELFKGYFTSHSHVCGEAELDKHFKELSDKLGWYQVPVGEINGVPYIWDANKTPQCGIIDPIGNGSYSLISTMISHFDRKGHVELFFADFKGIEYTPYKCLKSVNTIATTIREFADMTFYLSQEMKKRNKMCAMERLNSLPVDGEMQLKNTVYINKEHFVPLDTPVTYKTLNDETFEDYAGSLIEKQDDIVAVSIPEEKEETETCDF